MNSVLIVDETKSTRDLLEQIFSTMFFKTHLASNREEAIKIIKKHEPNLVILEYNTPNVDGIDILFSIKSIKEIKQPKIIFCTTTNTLEDIYKAIQAGCDDYIIKPFDKEIISTKLKILEVI